MTLVARRPIPAVAQPVMLGTVAWFACQTIILGFLFALLANSPNSALASAYGTVWFLDGVVYLVVALFELVLARDIQWGDLRSRAHATGYRRMIVIRQIRHHGQALHLKLRNAVAHLIDLAVLDKVPGLLLKLSGRWIEIARDNALSMKIAIATHILSCLSLVSIVKIFQQVGYDHLEIGIV